MYENHDYLRISTFLCFGIGVVVIVLSRLGIISLGLPLALLVGLALIILAAYTYYETSNWTDFDEMRTHQKVIPIITSLVGVGFAVSLSLIYLNIILILVFWGAVAVLIGLIFSK